METQQLLLLLWLKCRRQIQSKLLPSLQQPLPLRPLYPRKSQSVQPQLRQRRPPPLPLQSLRPLQLKQQQ